MFLRLLSGFGVLILGLPILVFGFSRDPSSFCPQDPCQEPTRSPFRYAIVYQGTATSASSQRAETFQTVNVLLDPASFSENYPQRIV